MRSLRVLVPLLLLVPTTAQADDQPAGGKPFGLERRLPWNDSRVVGSPEPPAPYKVVRAFPKLTIKQPLSLTPEPGTNRLFILQHLGSWAGPGRLLAVGDDEQAAEAETLLELDGLAVGLAFHPDYEHNGYLYIGMNGPVRGPKKTTQVVRYQCDLRPPYRIDPASKRLIIEWPSDGHDGGDLTFGNDGYLYVSSGDGSSDSDANLTGQSLADLQGAVLRIDVDRPDQGRNYGVPKDNPFVDRPGARPELWAYGLRNPWRLSFDRESGQLWAGNNGQDLWEQVYLIRKGANYGWSLSEGSHVFHSQRQAGPDPISLPAAEHPHSEARSLTGGRVCRSTRLPELVGAYLYGDWSTGRVWGIKHDGTKAAWHRELVDTPFNITGFGTDHAGELYVIDHGSGFYRLEPTTEADRPSQPFPTRLSATGLFASVAELRPHPAAFPYEVSAPQWADGATMERFAALPGLERVEQKPQLNAGGSWTLPNGSVLVQTLGLDLDGDAGPQARRRIETRLLARQQGEWVGYSYRWNAEQTDAELVPASGAAEELEVVDPTEPGGRREQTWRFPARTECLVCHSRAAGFVLSFSPLQLDRDRDFGGINDNQLRTLEHIGVFQGSLPARRDDRPRLVNPYDSQAPSEARVKSYLHVNCATCHVAEGGGNARMELGLTTPLGKMGLIDAVPLHNRFDIKDARLIAPHSPSARCSTGGSRCGGTARCLPWCPPRSTARPSS
ncbi:Glucose/arabinose dehydrogenase, beta-propeller fold [Singulisphaera sp. GP187]|uniref:PQQ-dependent sugar dehydrogenase n=1 Tax=Singulisphaera sp. GP187 TaxID=1882752 RepID=UPI00092B38E5|nr:PQQ-dependent sugar dehydrogenase [Singulisphaera sp. GP187]SIO32864.1 Glucose/arabinose dehydrogenase, beta-propeller fold [Singulisphaera sp. GP187]